MNMPGFTAENSIRNARIDYCLNTSFDLESASGDVEPARPKLCEVLAELVWAAYNEGAYNRAEFWGNVMEGAGCFN